MTGRVTRIEAESVGAYAVIVLTVERHPAEGVEAPDVGDLPDDIRRTLVAWLAGKQP